MRSNRFPIIACVLKSGGDFQPEHVRYLACQLKESLTIPHQFICLTDMEINHPAVLAIPLKNSWPGWWSKIELFKIPGCVVSFDLDTMLLGSIDSFVDEVCSSTESRFWMLKSFRPPMRGISGVLAWNGDFKWMYDEFAYETDGQKFRGDENYITHKLKERNFPISFVQKSLRGVYSWKRHCKGAAPEDCTALIFHGKPRPWEVESLWSSVVERYQEMINHA